MPVEVRRVQFIHSLCASRGAPCTIHLFIHFVPVEVRRVQFIRSFIVWGVHMRQVCMRRCVCVCLFVCVCARAHMCVEFDCRTVTREVVAQTDRSALYNVLFSSLLFTQVTSLMAQLSSIASSTTNHAGEITALQSKLAGAGYPDDKVALLMPQLGSDAQIVKLLRVLSSLLHRKVKFEGSKEIASGNARRSIEVHISNTNKKITAKLAEW